jgi:N-acetylglucosamine-6-phosphate deacetylase
MSAISAPRVVAGGRILSPGTVVVEQGRIAEVRQGTAGPDGLELDRGVLVPGLVDIQVNGAFGVDLAGAGPEGWAHVRRCLPSTGVTSFVPTFITAPLDELERAVAAAPAKAGPLDPAGSKVIGLHIEGPFISPERKGAHDPALMRDPSPELVKPLLDAGGGLVSMLTLAPERPGALDTIAALAGAGVIASVGHSDATGEQVAAAADAGARMVTHLFNAQRGLGHHEPGVAGQALADERLHLGLIADLVHVAAPIVRVVLRAAAGRVVLVTDAAAPAGMPPGRYELGGTPVEVDDQGLPRRLDGTLAGSSLRLDTAVANLVGLGVDPVTAVEAATLVPAGLIGRGDLGRLEPGAAADLAWLSDDWETLATWIDGEPVWSRRGAAS